ncbi:hypothetical protein [Bradyrhizobium lablabi]|uniref:hypothetical protein n=1 Tax=Bradyrhizobium lablabi TaxID=722472 RepID=UPI001BA8591E|nr:hypothetical protein [Bradyrhizobium lablabi]MBR0692032.1 hypothetical protein [Bradyrhizobium lablabi]
MAGDHFARLREKGITEARRLFWIFIYLWVLLALFALHKSIVLDEPDPFYHQGFVVINALVLAKIMFVAEALHVADNLKRKPLIYPMVYKSAVFSLILISFHVLEEVLTGMWHGKTVAETATALGGGGLMEISVFGVIMFVVLMPFFALREVGRDIGDDKLFEQFFVRRTRYIDSELAGKSP